MSSMPPIVDLDGLPSGSVTLAYTENDAATVIAPVGFAADVDSLHFNGGSLTVSLGFSGFTEDQLSILTDANILLDGSTVQYDADGAGGNAAVSIGTVSGGTDGADLVISFNTDDATAAAVTALMEHIAYLNNSENPSTAPRSVSFTLDDGDGGGTGSDTATINVTAVNDPPANTVPGPQVTDEDTPLTITGLQVADVDIGFSNVITVTLSVDHGTIHVDPSVLGGIDEFDIFDNDTSSVTLSCDPELVNITLAAGIVYTPNPDYNGSDTLTVVTSDGGNTGTGGVQADTDEIAITVNAVNDPPIFADIGGGFVPYTENGSAVVLDNDASVGDPDLGTFESYAGARLTLQRQGGASPDDVFGGTDTATGSLDLTHSNGIGENVSLDDGVTFIGTFGQPGDGTFAITFNGNASASDVEKVLRLITYTNTSDNPPASVLIDFTFGDGNGQPGGQDQGTGASPGTVTGTVTVEITQVNDAPQLVNVAPGAAYGIGTAGALLSPALGVFDLDATQPSPLTGLNSATISIVNGFVATDELFVNLTDDGSGHFITPDAETTNITLQSNATGTLMLVGQDTLAHWQAVLDAVSYKSTAADPTGGGSNTHRTITWTVNDGALDSQTPNTDPDNLVNTTILHFAVAPTLDLDASGAGTGFTSTFTENGAPARIADTDVSISDDSGTVGSATIILTNAKAGDGLSVEGALAGGIDSFIDTSVSGKITLQLFNAASLADYQAALGQIRFANSSNTPDTADRDITVVVSDGEVESNTTHATIHVIGGNDAPVVTGSVTLEAIPQNSGARLITQAELLSNAADPDGPSLAAINLAVSNGLGTLVDNHNGTWSYTPATGDTTSVSFAYQVTDGVASPVSDSATMDILGPIFQPDPPPTALVLVGSQGDDSFVPREGSSRIDALGGVDTITFNFRLVDARAFFVGNQVIIDAPNGSSHTVLTGFEKYVFTDGTVNNNDGSPLVDDLYYYVKNYDVWNAHVDADLHYEIFGWHEGRNPNEFFQTVVYLSANPDVKAAGINPLTHYDTVGWQQGLDPSIRFDTDAYLEAYPDVAAAHVDPLRHFLQFGQQEGRDPFAPPSMVAENGFDFVYYLLHNPDVVLSNADPFQHFQTVGWKEGRNPNAYFDTNGYLANYADVKAAGMNPLDHYHIFGWHEGRDPSVNFDSTSYLAAYPDVTGDPLKHFIQTGLTEGRQSFADGLWGLGLAS
jgi:Cadherin-like domain